MGNIALNKATSSNFSVLPFTPNKAVTGDASALNRWIGTVPGWIKVDLGNPYWVNSWIIKNMGIHSDWGSNYNMVDYKLQGSDVDSEDSGNWIDICSITNNSQNITQCNFIPCRYRYFRTYVTKGLQCNKSTAAIMEFELYEYTNLPYLSALTLTAGTLSPAFNKQVYKYTTKVPQGISQIAVTPTTTATNAIITVNDQIVQNQTQSQYIPINNTGTTDITVKVVVDGTYISEAYTITVTKEQVSQYLDNLVVNGAIRMMPAFNSLTSTYNVIVTAGRTSVTITPTAKTSGSTVNVSGRSVTSGQTSQPIDLLVGQNKILVYVENTSQQFIYTFNVNRPS